ncbi:MAG: methylmalonyl-CoA mutase family protein, partial [Bacteroidota bacterium]|nr:methylmalonyl-CoA mutase family protein [Bacteroidota bacterium]
MENKNNTSNTKLFEEFPPVSTQQWEDIIIKDLKGADYQKKLIWKTIEGFDVKPYYRAEDIKDLEHLNANPSEFPYTRGIKTDNNNWLIRADYCTSDIQNTNSHVLGAIEKGLDSVGFRVNNINTAEEMSLLLIGIDLTKTEINFLGARSYAKIIELFIEEIKRQNIDSSKVRGSLNFDSLSFALMHGDFHGDRKENFDEAVKIIKLIKENIPNFRAITINAQCMNNSGASNVQELGFALAIGNEYLSELTDRGLDIDTIASQIRFCFGVGSDYFMEIGKLRAARTLWAKIVEAYNPKHLESAYAFIHCITTSFNKSIFDPYVNMLRSTTESMSAAIGGCDSLTVNPFDSTYKRSD